MPILFKLLFFVFVSVSLLIFSVTSVKAVTLAQQTQEYSASLNVFQAIQELGTNLEGPLRSFTFRVHKTLPNIQQFDYTAQLTRIYDKTTNTEVARGCATGDPQNRLRGLTFNTEGVPQGYEDVTIDFSCRSFQFISGRRYLILVTNANRCDGCIKFASVTYGTENQDFFTGGGLRYANGNPFDFSHNSGSCDPIAYIWNDLNPTPRSGCNIWTNPRDDLYFVLSDTTPEPTPIPSPTPTPTPTPTPVPSKTPLILIPGIGGSELRVEEDTIWNKDDGHGGEFNHIYPANEKIWVNENEAANPGADDYFDVLRMKNDGITSEANVGLTGNLYSGAYQEAIDFFTSSGYTLNQDFFVFPYDWRKDIALTASSLDNKINQIKSQTGSQKVDIVAHSMGGLVARNYIADATRAQNVRKLFTLGTPHLGAAESLKSIVHGGCLTRLTLLAQFFCLGISPSEVKDVLQNMISGFQLIPSQTYFSFYSNEDSLHPYPYRTEAGVLNYVQIKNLLTILDHNISLFNPSETFHSLDSAFPNTNGVDVTIIAGSGIQTLGQIINIKTTSLLGIQSTKKDVLVISGDGTVPLFSASLNDPNKNLSYLGGAKVYYTNQKHEDLVINGPTLNLVNNILGGDNILPNGISEIPYKLGGFILSVHSPINMHAYDSNGNHTGPTPNGDFEANIPGSSYDTLSDAKFIYLPNDGIYNIKFEATNNGAFDFKIRKFENDDNTETILYKEIPLTNSTKAETTFDTSSAQPPVIEVDQDGDGSTDLNVENFSIMEGDANYDYTPPSISFDVSPKTIWPPNNKMVDVNIAGNINDENPYLTTIIVEDEYDAVEPKVVIENQTNINQTIKLEALRKGDDKDGRIYTIKVLATDLAGNTSVATGQVLVPHDQGKKK